MTLMSRPQVSSRTSPATMTAARVSITGRAYQDLALKIHGLCGPQELEGLKSETGVGPCARCVGHVGAVHGTSKGENDRTLLLDNCFQVNRTAQCTIFLFHSDQSV